MLSGAGSPTRLTPAGRALLWYALVAVLVVLILLQRQSTAPDPAAPPQRREAAGSTTSLSGAELAARVLPPPIPVAALPPPPPPAAAEAARQLAAAPRSGGDPNRPCYSVDGKPVRRFIFMKTHKTGTSTLVNVFHRVVMRHGLRAMYSRNDVEFAWQYPMRDFPTAFARDVFLPPPWDERRQQPTPKDRLAEGAVLFDAFFAGHSRYDREVLTRYVPNAQVFTIVREPITHFVSSFEYFDIGRRLTKKLEKEVDLREFLSKPEYYTEQMEEYERKLIWDSEGWVLGLPQKPSTAQIDDLIRRMDAEFDLVLITDYMDEGLVLLRRLFCWDLEDLTYTSLNVRSYAEKKKGVPADIAARIRELNPINSRLFDHFNATFHARLARELAPQADGRPSSFLAELAEFKRLQGFGRACHSWLTSLNWNPGPEYEESTRAGLLEDTVPSDVRACYLLNMDTINLSRLGRRLMDPVTLRPRITQHGRSWFGLDDSGTADPEGALRARLDAAAPVHRR